MATIYCVRIHYGPCNSFYTTTHKPGKLTGLRERLHGIGYRVQLIPEKFENYCMLEMCGHEVFRCNVMNLMFNTPYYLDPVCQRAVAAVQEATTKFLRARNHLWFLTMLHDRIFRTGDYRLLDHWPQKYEMESYAPLSVCIDCCGFYMATQRVVIYYGPYQAFHTLSLKPQKVAGLKDLLQKLGYRVDLVPVEYENYCMLAIGGIEVFRCNIKHLMFNTPYNHDPVCVRAVDAVLEGSKKLLRARDYLWFWTLLQDLVLFHGEFGLRDHHVTECRRGHSHIECSKKLERIQDCMKCCGVISKKN